MNLDLKKITERLKKDDFVKNFIKELNETLEKMNNKNKLEGEKMDDIKLTPDEELEFDKKEFKFLQDYFKEELLNLSRGEVFLVTNKYIDDNEYNRYKVAQYKNNLECKYIALGKDLPSDVQIGDIVRKKEGKYIYDEEATNYIKDSLAKIKQEIINNRN